MPRIVVFDSGLGGLSVLTEVRKARPDADIAYVADTAGFPYGGRQDGEVVRRVLAVFERIVAVRPPDVAVIACNTASTLVLPYLRASHDFPFVGTVPAIKPAAEQTRSGLISVLATPGTVKRDYTRALIESYASNARVTLIGATGLAALAEAAMRGEAVDDAAIGAEIAPVFVEEPGRRTDVVVLGCTHYPLVLDRLRRLAPWPVTWIDPAPAIARRVTSLLAGMPVGATAGPGEAVFTGRPADPGAMEALMGRFGLTGPAHWEPAAGATGRGAV
ncbi:glutamate racemase [Microbaculum marinum]|uniref:Glutamate racemase n=1 Tax=Microbaculum marinum TaxID=1764581 RepID=A0AAW9RZA3_9HYPH